MCTYGLNSKRVVTGLKKAFVSEKLTESPKLIMFGELFESLAADCFSLDLDLDILLL